MGNITYLNNIKEYVQNGNNSFLGNRNTDKNKAFFTGMRVMAVVGATIAGVALATVSCVFIGLAVMADRCISSVKKNIKAYTDSEISLLVAIKNIVVSLILNLTIGTIGYTVIAIPDIILTTITRLKNSRYNNDIMQFTNKTREALD
jgi:hypothetical protein